MGLYIGNTKYKVMSGNNKASLFPVYPYDAEIEYLESTGTQYMDLDYFQGNKLQINLDCECYLVQTPEVNIISNQSGSSSTSGGRFVLGLSYGKVFIYSRNNNSQSDGNAAISLNGRARKQITAIFNQSSTKTLTIEGETVTAPCVRVSNSNRKVRLFSGINGSTGEAAVFYSGRLYSVKFYKDDILWIDLIPVRIGTTGYMYDRMRGKLFGNSGTGSFVLGPDKPIYDAEVEYLQSTGTQYINTGIVVTSTDNMFIDFQNTTSYSYQAFYAGRRTNENNATSYSLGQINGKFDGRLGSGNLGYGTSINLNRHTLELDPVNGNVIQDSSTTASCGTFASSNLPVYLFGVNTNGAAGYSQYPIRVFEFSISDKIHLIPVRVGQVGYMYDTISHKLFGNAGTGSFIVGNDKN